ncbi:MAG: TRAP transporter substrate-binding protein [Rhizobium sp.]|nr:TRAP transporter substrate-binding protein [Rhizobium sp.]MBW8318422.1 TRAP transporter substrate-binding protein [Rhizobium sp.]MBW8445337.1 TRAP transporter substrate-binding protein [Arenimonas sp.]
MKFTATIKGAVLALMTTGAAQAADYRISMIVPPSHQWAKSATAMAERIKERTDGRVNIMLFPSGQLGPESQMVQQMQTGALDFAFLTLGELANRDDDFGILAAPYLVPNIVAAGELLDGATADKLEEKLPSFGLKGLGWGVSGMRQVVLRDKIETVNQLAGKKIRTIPYAPELDLWTGLKAVPTPMPLPALFDAFANGQVDGMQIDLEGTWNTKYYSNAAVILNSDHGMFPMLAAASGRKWAQIAPEDQAIIAEEFATESKNIIAAYAKLEQEFLANLKGTDVPVVKVDRAWFGPAIDAYYEQWKTKSPLFEGLLQEAAKLN